MPRKWKFIVVHHTATNKDLTVQDVREMHTKPIAKGGRGFSDIGYHYLIQRDSAGSGHLKSGRPDTKDGAHCPKFNKTAIGVSVIGYFHPGQTFSEHLTTDMPLYSSLVEALTHLCKKYNITPDYIMYHRDAKATACPGDWFVGKDQLIEDVTNKLQ